MKDDERIKNLEALLWSGVSKISEHLEKQNDFRFDCSEHSQHTLEQRIPKLLEVSVNEQCRSRTGKTHSNPEKAIQRTWKSWSQYDWHNRNTADQIRAYEVGCSYPSHHKPDDGEEEICKFPEAALSKEHYQALAPILYDIRSDSEAIEDELQRQRGDTAKKRMMQAFADIRDSFPKGPIYYHILWFWTHEIKLTWPPKTRMTKLLESLQDKFPDMSREAMRQYKCRAMKEAENLLAEDDDALWMFLYYKYAPFEKPEKYLSDKALIRRYKQKEPEPGPVVIIDAAMADSIHSNRPVYNTATSSISHGLPNGVVKEVLTYAESERRKAEIRELRHQNKKAGLDQRVDKAVSDTPKSSHKRGPCTSTKKPSRSKGMGIPSKPSTDDAA